MINRFEQFSSSISTIYKYLQKLEKIGMEKYNLKGSHTQCVITMLKYPDGISATELCSLCGKDKASISRSLAELEETGHIERVSKSGNLYQAKIRLTPSGVKAAEQVSQTVMRVVEKAGEGLSDDVRKLFYSSLDLICENLKNIYLAGEL